MSIQGKPKADSDAVCAESDCTQAEHDITHLTDVLYGTAVWIVNSQPGVRQYGNHLDLEAPATAPWCRAHGSRQTRRAADGHFQWL